MAVVLGYTTIGSVTTGGYTGPAQIGCLFVAGSTELFDEVYVYMQSTTATASITAAIYHDNNTTPSDLCFSTKSYTLIDNGAFKWYSIPLRGIVQASTNYWIVISCDKNFLMKYDNGGANQTFDDYTTYGTWGNPYNTTPDAYYNAIMSFYLKKSDSSAYVLNGYNFYNNNSGIGLNVPLVYYVTVKAGFYNITAGDGCSVYLVNSISSFNIFVPTPIANNDTYIIKNVGLGVVNILQDAGSSALVDGQVTYILTRAYEEVMLVNDNTNWYIV
jgi:hypothetical protein